MNPFTQLVRFDASPGDPWRANSTPIYQTATFAQESATEFGAFDYSRSANPTRAVLETQLARLEMGERAFAFASGMAALSALTRLVPCGGHILAGNDLYGGSYRLLEQVAPRLGLKTSYVDVSDLDAVERAFVSTTQLLLIETPTNPLQRIADIRSLAKIAQRHGARLAVDNSLLSPWLQKPLELGADVVVHSATKHLCGHGDVLAGALVVRDADLAAQFAFFQNAEGNALAPFDCWLLLRGMKTLGVRLERAQANAARIAKFLAAHPRVQRVHYAALRDCPARELHFSQAGGAGSVLSFETGDALVSKRIVEALQLFTISVSFGSTTSQVSLPCSMSHKSIPASVRSAHALPDDLVRLSVGIECADDLIADLAAALA
jgi:cystathionine beta-lyase